MSELKAGLEVFYMWMRLAGEPMTEEVSRCQGLDAEEPGSLWGGEELDQEPTAETGQHSK